jgi:hypothetical protein
MFDHDFHDQPSIADLSPADYAECHFSAYGLRFGLRAQDAAALAQACATVPLGWQAAPGGAVDIRYSLELSADTADQHLLYCGSALVARARDLTTLLALFTKHAELLTAFRAKNCLFVHAGVVGWRGRAILVPGRSMAGKTTLVAALIAAGAVYYSDEFAVLDQRGLVHAYALPLSIRGEQGQPARPTPAEALGGQVGAEPLPVGLVVMTSYKAGARWRPRVLSPGQALLALMDNTVAAQREPEHSMPILRAAVQGAALLQGRRGEAGPAARALLRRLAMTHDRRGGS